MFTPRRRNLQRASIRVIISIGPTNMLRLFPLALTVLGAYAQDGPFIGLVERADPPGSFTRVSDGKVVRPLDEVFPGVIVHPVDRTKGFIRIVYVAGGKWGEKCTEEQPCKQAYRVPVPSAQAPAYFAARPKLSEVFATHRGFVGDNAKGL